MEPAGGCCEGPEAGHGEDVCLPGRGPDTEDPRPPRHTAPAGGLLRARARLPAHRVPGEWPTVPVPARRPGQTSRALTAALDMCSGESWAQVHKAPDEKQKTNVKNNCEISLSSCSVFFPII